MGTEFSASNFFFSVAASLVAMLAGAILRRLIVPPNRRTRIIHYVLLLALLLTGAIPVYYVFSWFLGITLSEVQFRVAFCAWLVQLVAGYLLYSLMRQEVDERQYDNKLSEVRVKKEAVRPPAIPVRRLHQVSSDPNKRIRLNWKTFSDGVDFLVEQIRDRSGGGPDICLGINDAGTAIASLIAGALGGKNPIPLGSVVAKGTNVGPNGIQTSLPDQKEINTILVVDMEIKTGKSLKKVVNHLKERYRVKTENIDIAVLVASQVRGSVRDIKELQSQGVFMVEHDYLPDFLAFTSINRVTLVHDIQ